MRVSHLFDCIFQLRASHHSVLTEQYLGPSMKWILYADVFYQRLYFKLGIGWALTTSLVYRLEAWRCLTKQREWRGSEGKLKWKTRRTGLKKRSRNSILSDSIWALVAAVTCLSVTSFALQMGQGNFGSRFNWLMQLYHLSAVY